MSFRRYEVGNMSFGQMKDKGIGKKAIGNLGRENCFGHDRFENMSHWEI